MCMLRKRAQFPTALKVKDADDAASTGLHQKHAIREQWLCTLRTAKAASNAQFQHDVLTRKTG